MKSDKRKQERLNANLFVELESLAGDILGRGVVIDVSLSGFGVDTEADLPIEKQIECHLEVPLRLRATVVRIIPGGQMKRYGLRFKGQSFLDKFLLKKILKGNRHTKKIS